MFIKADDLLKLPNSENWSKISFGCSSLDNCTNGGIITRGITEIYGEAGAGKTQILMQLCLTVQLSKNYGGFQKSAAILYTEGQFPSNRLIEMAICFGKKYQVKPQDLMDRIFIQHIKHADMLMECLSNQLISILKNNSIGLIIIDSIGAVFRGETKYGDRAKNLKLLGHKFSEIAQEYKCAIVCSNQVTSVDGYSIPCLGLTWSNQVRSRIKIAKHKDEPGTSKSQSIRKFEISYSPEIGSGHNCTFLITDNGISDNQ